MNNQSLSQPEFIAAYMTLAGNVERPLEEASPHDFFERAETAAQLGYRGLGLLHTDLIKLRDQHGYVDMRRTLDALKLSIELEFLVGWMAEGDELAEAESLFCDMLTAAEELGAERIKLGPDMLAKKWPMDHMCERFAKLCRRAQPSGTEIVLEPMPWSNIADLDSARDLIEGANEPNGGLIIDIWHMARGGVSFDEIARLPAGMIKHAELNDADKEIRGTLLEDSFNHRKFCGQGELDIQAFIQALNQQGYDGVYGIEIISEVQRQRPYREVARDAIDTARPFFPK